MSIQNKGVGSWLVRARMRINGKMHNRTRIVKGTRLDAKQVETTLSSELLKSQRSLKSQKIICLKDALDYYKNNTDADLKRDLTYFKRLKRDIGGIRITCLNEKFGDYWRLLKTERAKRTGELLSNGTRNKLLIHCKVSLNFCVKRGLISENPLKSFDKLPETSRDRVLTESECTRIMNVMQLNGSYLYWPFYFSLKNPIRLGDLRNLTKENLDWFKPWIHFYASKTMKRKKRETCLPFLDESLMEYFKSLPEDCPYLFPRIDSKGRWFKLGDPKRHWHSILQQAEIKDLRWHDLKHHSISWILDNGYSALDLKNLGIQYSDSMINRYYHFSAEKVLLKVKNGSKNTSKTKVVALSSGTHDAVSL